MNIEQAAGILADKYFGPSFSLYGVSMYTDLQKIYICYSSHRALRNSQKIPKEYEGFKVKIIDNWERIL